VNSHGRGFNGNLACLTDPKELLLSVHVSLARHLLPVRQGVLCRKRQEGGVNLGSEASGAMERCGQNHVRHDVSCATSPAFSSSFSLL